MKRILIVLTLILLAGQAEAVRLVVDDVDATTGCFHAKSNAYAAARDTIEATDSYSSATRLGWDNSNKQNYRILTRWLTLPIPDAAVIDSAKIKLPVTTNSSTTDFFLKLCAVDPDSLQGQSKWTKGEYNGFVGWDATPGNPYTVTLLADTVSTSTLGAAPADTLTLRLNAAGIAAISKSDTTQFYILSNIDANYVSLSNDAYIYINDDNLYMEVFYHIEGLYLDATSGSDLAAGDASNPWKTLSPVNLADLIAGDYVYLKAGDEYGANQTGQDGTSKSDTCLVVPSSGSEGSPITFTRYGTGADPIISAAMQVQGWAEIGTSQIFVAATNVGGESDSVAYVMWKGANKDSIMTRIRNLTAGGTTVAAHKEWQLSVGKDSIYMYLNADADTTNLYKSKTYCISNSRNYININNMIIQYGTGFGGYQSAIYQSGNFGYFNNIFILEGGSNQGKCLAVSGDDNKFVNLIVYGNTVNSNYSISLASSAQRDTVYNSIFYGGSINAAFIDSSADSHDIRNNIFVNATHTPLKVLVRKTPTTPYTSTNNFYYRTTGTELITYNGTNYTSISTFYSATGWDANSKSGNPLLDSNYRLLYGSPAINAGTSVGVTTDYDGNTRGTIPDIGAFERLDSEAGSNDITNADDWVTKYTVPPNSWRDKGTALSGLPYSGSAPEIGPIELEALTGTWLDTWKNNVLFRYGLIRPIHRYGEIVPNYRK